jgi:hypothetical protein
MLPPSSGYKMDTARSSETSVNMYQTAQHHIQEDSEFQSPSPELQMSHSDILATAAGVVSATLVTQM